MTWYGYPFIFIKDCRFLVCSFSRLPFGCYSVSIRLICRAIRTTKSADKVLVPQHWIIGFWQKYSFEWRKAWIRDMSGNFWCFLCLKMSLFAQFLSSFLHRGIEVAFAFWGGLNFRVNFKSVPFLCEKCPFLSYLGCLEEAINPIAKSESFFARNWKLVW